ncbi:CAG repeat protein 32 [Sesbania bispinosa]|nr:CAG repeat protein 32 [Sesbania bispinosa]
MQNFMSKTRANFKRQQVSHQNLVSNSLSLLSLTRLKFETNPTLCNDEAHDEPGGGAGEERAHDDSLRNHDNAAKGERHLAQWGWYGWWQHRSSYGEEEDTPVCVTATIVARLEQGSAFVVNAEVDSMGGVVDDEVGIGLKTSPRRAAIEKAQAELR